ncbi:U1 snRNP protein [Elasticomyces elasticus]|nr:U1 snRNP protein [Elasticomyces elasticus]
MSGWKEAKTADGKAYYFHAETKETTWVKPEGFEAPPPLEADQATIDASWRETRTPQGKPYYYNAISKVTVWEPPEAFTRLQQQNAPPEAAFVAGGGRGYGGDRDEPPVRDRRLDRRAFPDAIPQKPSFDGPRRDGGGGGKPWENRQDNGGFRGPMPEKTDEPEYATKELAEEAFFALLKKHNITANAKWEETLRTVIREREFRSLKDPRERREAFEKYRVEVRALEKSKEKERREKLREDFREMLKTHDDIKHYTRWRTARPLIELEVVFKQAGEESERRRMFDEYIMELRRRHSQEEIDNRKKAMRELDGLLNALITDPDTTWVDAQKRITESERFTSDDTFRALHMVDILRAFDSHLRELDYVRNNAKQKEKLHHSRRERQARDAFKQLLDQKLREGKIRAGTKWQNFHPLIATDKRYTQLIGTPGSSALDLFWDVVEDEERKLRVDRNLALDALEDQRYEMTVDTILKDFTAVMQADARTSHFAPELVDLIFERLMEKVWRRADEEKQAAEKSRRRAIDALRSVIKRLDPPVRLGDLFKDVEPRIASEEEYRVLEDDEEARLSAFEKHLRRLQEKETEDLEQERRRRDRDRDRRGSNGVGSRRERDIDRDRRHRTRTPEADAYEADRRKAQAVRERLYRKPSFGLTPPPRDRERDRERRDDRPALDDRRRYEARESIYDRERREREMERERNYISRADPRDKGRTLDYGDEDAVGSGSGSVRKRQESNGSANPRDNKRARRTRTPEPEGLLKEEEPALQSGSEEGEIEEV